jgi:GTP-binding protein
MIKYLFKDPKFVKSAIFPKDYPVLKTAQGGWIPEIAVVGRSNVGKSSLLNHLFGVKQLVKTSSTPGKTRMVNFFSLNDALIFADLPGYGYAQAPQEIRKEWGPMIEAYLRNRASLQLILFLFDIRRIPSEEDRALMEWMAQQNKAVILVLTKVDKVKAHEQKQNTQKIINSFAVQNLHYTHYSVPKHVGREKLVRMIQDALSGE